MRKPSTRMQINSKNLNAARSQWQHDMDVANVPFAYKQMYDTFMTSQLAILERLDALVELQEHYVVDHVCKDAHTKTPKSGTGGLDTFLGGIGPEDNPKKEE